MAVVASQFQSLYFFPSNLKITWDYREANHFKGPRDGIAGAVKRKVHAAVKVDSLFLSR